MAGVAGREAGQSFRLIQATPGYGDNGFELMEILSACSWNFRHDDGWLVPTGEPEAGVITPEMKFAYTAALETGHCPSLHHALEHLYQKCGRMMPCFFWDSEMRDVIEQIAVLDELLTSREELKAAKGVLSAFGQGLTILLTSKSPDGSPSRTAALAAGEDCRTVSFKEDVLVMLELLGEILAGVTKWRFPYRFVYSSPAAKKRLAPLTLPKPSGLEDDGE